MTVLPTSLMPSVISPPADVSPPRWVESWLGRDDIHASEPSGASPRVVTSREATLLSLRVPNAQRLDALALRSATADLYRELLRLARQAGHPHVVRIWNHLPGIHDPLGEERDRYRVFNAGRFDALTEAFGGRAGLAAFTPAATGVGHAGCDLIVHALAIDAPSQAVENPAQIPAYCYSERFGRLPPCFARATVVRRPKPAILVAGTAAISGEESRHVGSLPQQLDLTLANLRGLIRAADPSVEESAEDELRRFSHVRVYLPKGSELACVRPIVDAAFATAEVDYVTADLCRPELLVEIEGLAHHQDFEGSGGLHN